MEYPVKAGFDIEWIELGNSNNTQIKTWINSYNGISETDYAEGDVNGNKCDVDTISKPDNLSIMDDGQVFIGEDTSKHVNNTI